MVGLLIGCAILALFPLFSVFLYVCQQGLPGLHVNFFTSLPKPVGEVGGGMANAVLGSLILITLASLIGIPVGIATGVYLSEYGKTKLSMILRFCTELLAGVPSIIIGIFAYSLFVIPMGRFSSYAGGAALAVIMIPTVARTTEELLKLVPVHIREAGLALGISRWKVTLIIVLRGSLSGIMTGVMLGLARVTGETAPLLFTALGSQYWPRSLDQPIASLPVQIYTYAISPFEEWHQQAWTGALVLVLFVFILNLTTRMILKRHAPAKD
ncbi:MAG: phosphate ABC transporter permease PstA [Methylotenera sp.]|nr:phosphate ABC transporter permease PstA [Oligoflexia bacterium]